MTDKEILKHVIDELRRRIDNDKNAASDYFKGALSNSETLLSYIESMMENKHSYFETIYHVGTEPTWKVGDILAWRDYHIGCEGNEIIEGKVIKITYDNRERDWIYTFEDGHEKCEEYLIDVLSYKKYEK